MLIPLLPHDDRYSDNTKCIKYLVNSETLKF
ncbi:MAG: hypothetical protein ACI8SJ_002408, partial [Shewanella sp.]